jgi:ABC-2 type transport system permease protein
MVNWKSRKLGDLLLLANGIVLLVLVNLLSSLYFFRVDLTDEQRYSIKEPTKKILQSIDDDVHIEVFLTGEMNAGFQRFRKALDETLEEFRIYSGNKLQYSFTDPSAAASEKARNEFMADLAAKGIQPTRVFDNQKGQRTEKIIFPGVVISYAGAEKGVMLLRGNKASSPEEEINQSIEGVEFELANAIYKLTTDSPKKVGMVIGHGELEGLQSAAFRDALMEVYDVQDVNLKNDDLGSFDALVIAKPIRAFSETEKYRLDQYIVQRGNVLFLLDQLEANMDSASRVDYFAFPYNINLDDQLFRYGVRLNPDLVQDRVSGRYPIVTGQNNNKSQIQLVDWPFFPLINNYAQHEVTANLDAVMTTFVSSIDTVKAEGIKKTPLLLTSQYSRRLTAPVSVSIQSLRKDITPENFNTQFIPVGYLLEGRFTSLYKNRFLPEGEDSKTFKDQDRHSKIIVVADGDIAKNVVNPRTQQPQPLGFDPISNYTFANQDLLLNMLAYLTDENGLIKARNKEIKIRPLDKEKVVNERVSWQIINLVMPLVVLVVFGLIWHWRRKKRYASF